MTPARRGSDEVVDWLIQGDSSVSWQALRDLLGAPARMWRAERRKIGSGGWGQRLLASQREDGHWGRGPYQPKWTCTTYTGQLLWQMGLEPDHPAGRAACRAYLEDGIGDDGGINFWRPRRKTSETCVTGMIVGQASYFGADHQRLEGLVDYLLREQMEDGGWNCCRATGAVHSSFHTTLSALEGLREYAGRGRARSDAAARAAARGREFLLAHHLFRSHRTGRVVSAEMTRFHFPPHWHYDVLRALDYFQSVGASYDPRLEDAVELVRSRRAEDGRWQLARAYPGEVHVEMEVVAAPSRWNTLRGLRVLAWWNRISPTMPRVARSQG